MGVNDIDVLSSNDPAKQSQELKIERKFLGRRTNLGVRLGAKGSRAMHFCPAHLDILLTKRISHDLNVVTHLPDGVRHFLDPRSRPRLGWKGTGRHHPAR